MTALSEEKRGVVERRCALFSGSFFLLSISILTRRDMNIMDSGVMG
jgi:hypothetical protein